MNTIKFILSGKTVEVFSCGKADMPIVYLNTYADNGKEVYNALNNTEDLTLVVIGGLDWDSDMSPWEIPPISANDTPCKGGADGYLRLLTDEIVPEVEKNISGKPPWRGIAGYSLAGLFAVYSAYKTKMFTRIASVSGSLWFPDFKEFVFRNQMKTTPERMYFSVGDKECKTRNKFLQSVQTNTEEIERFYKENGINTIFELNSGNHFVNAAERTARGISWICREED